MSRFDRFIRPTPDVFAVNANGWHFVEQGFYAKVSAILSPHISRIRQEYIFGDREMAGRRFFNDKDVLARATSALDRAGINKDAYTDEEIHHLIETSLRDCASADHWYTYEKEW